ncbi:DUF3179 domain-containing (seleno)protein [Hyunsoonleella ulvae]|uniref:DUF3179 domain-containing (seleno)protein n=1 Tax=Hyunsoonleella ulvae TaxID=2799948 RepID=UPI00193A8D49|nr:DUF3179 domain-containing (seleno)protein [Hyunsoonleella ulvae]
MATVAFLIAFTIAFGRQTAVFGKVKQSLWFFSNYEFKRIVFSLTSIVFGLLSWVLTPSNAIINALLITALLLIILSFLFDFKYIFPEVKKVERELGSKLNISGETEIIGISIKNLSVAYPLDVVIPRHIINDNIEGINIVVSYCAICRSALIFSAELEGEKLYFKVSAVWRRNMVMIDDQSKSLWQQATGECIYGKYKGKHLKLLSGENTNWNSWVTKHPNSEFAYKCIEARKGYSSRGGMLKALNFITPKITPPGFTDLKGLPTRETVFGISYNGISRAYPKSELKNKTIFSDTFDKKKLNLKYDQLSEYLTATDAETKEEIIVEKHWWLGWKEFHPNTEIWDKNT